MTRQTSAIAADASVAAAALDFASFRNAHAGASILVCGCGESLNTLERPESVTTIGVNDVGRRFTPTYLVVVNRRSQFAGDRFRFVETSGARALFTQLPDLGVAHPQLVRFRLGTYGGTDLAGGGVLHYTQNSPYVAVCLAVHMGAARIGCRRRLHRPSFLRQRPRGHLLAGAPPRLTRNTTPREGMCCAWYPTRERQRHQPAAPPRPPLESFIAGARARATSRPPPCRAKCSSSTIDSSHAARLHDWPATRRHSSTSGRRLLDDACWPTRSPGSSPIPCSSHTDGSS